MPAERIVAALLTGPGRPTLVVDCRAFLACGCSCFVGLRQDTWEAARLKCAMSGSWSGEHETAAVLLRESTVDPQARPLVDVAAELLEQAARHRRVPA